MSNLLKVHNLNVSFQSDNGIVPAVRDVCLSVASGTTHGIVGESGSGKSVTCQAIMGLTPENAYVSATALTLEDTDLLRLNRNARSALCGREIAMIFQDPLSALNPVHSVGAQIREVLKLHRGMSGQESTNECIKLLETVGIPDPHRRLREFPHQLSGGMSQRVMIAMALACRPSLLIADEPTTALDVTVQAQILDLLKRLQVEIEMTIILITHDIGIIAEMADDVTVMHRGEAIETGPVSDVLRAPRHDYTRRLLSQIPRIDCSAPTYCSPTESGAQ